MLIMRTGTQEGATRSHALEFQNFQQPGSALKLKAKVSRVVKAEDRRRTASLGNVHKKRQDRIIGTLVVGC